MPRPRTRDSRIARRVGRAQTSGAIAKLALIAIAIALLPQGVWSALIAANLRTTPALPWSVLVMVGVMIVLAQYLRGEWGPQNTAAARRQALRATLVPLEIFRWSAIAGALSMTALVGVWIVLASLIRMPGSVLPNLSMYPWWTVALAIAMGMAISPLCEQAGVWGYLQGGLERHLSKSTAAVVTALVFALLPHPPAGMQWAPRILFFLLVGLVFSTIARFTGSILPSLPVHALGLLVFFVVVWPYDRERRLVSSVGTDGWFWLHVGQAVLFGALGVWAFGELARVSARFARAPAVR